jgi:hypothetical protein
MTARFYMNQRVKLVSPIPAREPHGPGVPVGVIGFIKQMPRNRIIEVDLAGAGARWVLDHEIEPYPVENIEQLNISAALVTERRKPDPVVRVMYDALKATTTNNGLPTTTHKQVNAAIGQAIKHFKWLQAVTLVEKEVMIAETFPGIWRETRAVFSIYSTIEWAAMIDVLYLKALQSRGESHVVTGSINPIEAKNLKNLG